MLRRAAAPANQLCFSVLLSRKQCLLASRPRPHLFAILKCQVSEKKKTPGGLSGQRVLKRQVRPHSFPTYSRFPELRIENVTFIKQPRWFRTVCCKRPSVFNCPKCTEAGSAVPRGFRQTLVAKKRPWRPAGAAGFNAFFLAIFLSRLGGGKR